MILIADGGSTKTSWCLANKKNTFYFETEGYNPFFVDSAYIVKSLKNSLPKEIQPDSINEIHFYGAGCFPETISIVEVAFKELFKNAKSYIEVDLLAAARSVLGIEPGFVAILGTGTNTCIYNGKEITHNIHSLGFFLGDEGSGGAIGKKLISDFIREEMPTDIASMFFKEYGLTAEEIFDRVYNKPKANRFCANFCKFIGENIEYEYLQNIVKMSFNDLFKNLVSHYDNYQNYKFNCIGSVGLHFKDILTDVANNYNMEMGKIVKSPMERLVSFHINQNQTNLK